MAWFYRHSGDNDPDVKLKVGSYTKIPGMDFTPDWTSDPDLRDRPDPWLFCYVNITYTLKPYFLEGRIRFRMIRDQTDPPDATALRNRTLARESCAINDPALKLVSEPTSWCDEFFWAGAVVKGRKMWGEIDSDSCFASLAVTAWYIKVEKWANV